MGMIIGIGGKARSGKDSVAQIIKDLVPDVQQYNLADPLKACVNDWLGWGYEHGYGVYKETPMIVLNPNFDSLIGYVIKHFPDHVTPEQAVRVASAMSIAFQYFEYEQIHKHNLNKTFIVSPRQVYQWFGTDCMREQVADDIWLQLIPEDATIILADVRFENEAEYCRSRGKMLHITRPDQGEIENSDHESENGVSVHDEDILILNDSTLDDLRETVVEFINSRIQP